MDNFDTENIYYHGTNADFDQFEEKESVREGFMGFQEKVTSPVKFFTQNKATAHTFAENRAENLGGEAIVKSYFLDMNKTLDLSGGFSVVRYENVEDGCFDIKSDTYVSSRPVNDTQLELMNNKASYDALSDLLGVDLVGEGIADYDMVKMDRGLDRKRYKYSNEGLLLLLDDPTVANKIKAAGYDSILCQEGSFEGQTLGKSVAVFDNDQIIETSKYKLESKQKKPNKHRL